MQKNKHNNSIIKYFLLTIMALFIPLSASLHAAEYVSKNTLLKIQQNGKTENYFNGELSGFLAKRFREKPLFNSYQWDAVFSDGDFYKTGMNGQGIYISPNKDIVVA